MIIQGVNNSLINVVNYINKRFMHVPLPLMWNSVTCRLSIVGQFIQRFNGCQALSTGIVIVLSLKDAIILFCERSVQRLFFPILCCCPSDGASVAGGKLKRQSNQCSPSVHFT